MRIVVVLCMLSLAGVATADEKRSATVDFARDVFPLLQRACVECHGAERQRGKLRLDERAALLKGGSSGPVVVPGKADASELYRRVTLPKGHENAMPARGEPLAKAQTDLLRDWINQGAPWPDNVQVARHWAYVKPTRPALPPLTPTPLPQGARGSFVSLLPQGGEGKGVRGWPRNAIDHFVLARLVQEGLTPSPEAGREQWLRRASLDLIGLPPTLAEVEAFLTDMRPGAYERVVDRLLASAQYGERWARPWLDLARYADSHGFQRDDLRDVWPYRDWVVRALNADMPFDQFTIEQLAGDLLPDPTRDQLVATGFHRCVTTNVEAGSDQEDTRVNQVFDRVNTTATVWLGSTFECAQCHDHKYDPFSQKDYYRLFAFFNNTEKETDFTNPKAMAALKFTGPYLPLPALVPEWKPVGPKADAAARKPRPAQTLVMRELPQPRESAVFKRGSFLDRGEPVTPGVPVLFGAAELATRLDLARWLVSRANPLAARAAVNRAWAEFFGRGLVATPEDFGIKGDLPTHLELLDWLAIEFMESGWSMKALQRLIVLSTTYRQSSRVTPEVLVRDDQNRLLARGPRFRLDAERIRDNALAAAGLLSLKQGGPPVRPYQPPGLWENKVGGDRVTYETSAGEDRYRRGLYVVWKRGSPYPSFVNFDATARTACVVQRSRSNTPLQALTLLNDPVYVEAAQALARRVLAERLAAGVEERITYAFRLCLMRSPRPTELAVLKSLFDAQRHGDEFAAWCTVAAALLNLDEMISK